MHCLGSILGEERIEEIVEIVFFFGSILSQDIMVSMLLHSIFFIREQMTHFRPHLGGGLAPLDSLSSGVAKIGA